MQYYYHVQFLIQFIVVWNVKYYYYDYHHEGRTVSLSSSSSSLIYVHGWMYHSSYHQCRYKATKMNFHKKFLIEKSYIRRNMKQLGNSKLIVNDYDPTMASSSQQNHEQEQHNYTYSHNFITPRRHVLEVILGSSVTSVLLQEPLLHSANAVTTTSSTSQLTSTDSENLEQRLQSNIIQQPNIGTTTTTSNGNDMTIYPYYMYGTWNVTQTLVSVQAPLGLQYMGGPNGNINIAQQSMKETQQQINQPISFQLRFIKCKLKRNNQSKTNTNNKNKNDTPNDYVVIVEDRLFNTRQRFNAYAKQNVVSNVVYANTKSSNNDTMNQLYECDCSDNNDNDTTTTTTTATATNTNMNVPLTTTITYFKGPAVQKMFVLAHHNSNTVPTTTTTSTTTSTCTSLSSISKWTGYEYQRTIFALTNRNTVPPITTDTELIVQYQPIFDTTTNDDDCKSLLLSNHNHLIGTLRIINYLTPNDQYYFNVHNRGVTIQDYKLDMYRIF